MDESNNIYFRLVWLYNLECQKFSLTNLDQFYIGARGRSNTNPMLKRQAFNYVLCYRYYLLCQDKIQLLDK